jgi:hypothetical protein
MPRRKRLKSVANDVLGSFISRNNDLEGYWALGKLYSLALSRSTNTVELDLLSGRLSPDDRQFATMACTYTSNFEKLLRRQNVPRDRVHEAKITVHFNVPVQQGHYPLLTYGKPLDATLDIVDREGTRFSVSKLSWCHPHDPLVESRSGRAAKP